MNKKVLAIYYSQSGQLGEIVDRFCEPLTDAGLSIEKVRVTLQNEYPFPWTAKSFFSVMPDCVLGVPAGLTPFTLKEARYDLVVLGYQAWFLSPSVPFASLMNDPGFRMVLTGTPVITITGARNMWVNAFGKVRKLLGDAQARLVGNIALVDRHLNLVSIFTIFHWMLRGKKSRYLHVFPKPGVSAADIANARTFGATVLPYLKKNDWSGMQAELVSKKAVVLKYHLMFIESKAGIMFRLWANFIAKRKNRTVWLIAFKYYLFIALFVLAPIVFLIDLLVFKPFLSKYIRAKKEFYLKLN